MKLLRKLLRGGIYYFDIILPSQLLLAARLQGLICPNALGSALICVSYHLLSAPPLGLPEVAHASSSNERQDRSLVNIMYHFDSFCFMLYNNRCVLFTPKNVAVEYPPRYNRNSSEPLGVINSPSAFVFIPTRTGSFNVIAFSLSIVPLTFLSTRLLSGISLFFLNFLTKCLQYEPLLGLPNLFVFVQ